MFLCCCCYYLSDLKVLVILFVTVLITRKDATTLNQITTLVLFFLENKSKWRMFKSYVTQSHVKFVEQF